MMKRTILFSFFLSLFAFGLNAQSIESTEYMKEMAKQEGILQASVAKSDIQRNLDNSLDRYEIAMKNNDALEMKEMEGVIASQIDAMIGLQTDSEKKSAQTSLLRSFQTMNTKDKTLVTAMLTKLRTIEK